MKKINERIHWEFAKGSRRQNLIYCTKEGNHECSWIVPEPLDIITKLWPWQKEVEDIILRKPEKRIIHWFWEPEGNAGKTSLIKYLLTKYEYITFSRASKSADILTCADIDKTVYLFDFARHQEGFTPWLALEQLKDGLVTDSKLKKESRNVIMNTPHVICFANWAPDVSGKLSLDKFKLTRIEVDPLVLT